MNILDIYKKYSIADHLKMHMLRVAAIAQTICDNFDGPINTDLIIKACLLHDIGNIVKFDFNYFDKDWFKPQGVLYWKKLQNKFIKKYGLNDHLATFNILNELSVNKNVYELIDRTGISKSETIYQSSDFNLKILVYSDLRVSPYGVVTVKERFKEAQKRYRFRPDFIINLEELGYYAKKKFGLEKQIFCKCNIKPSDITDKNIEPIIKKLYEYDIELDH